MSGHIFEVQYPDIDGSPLGELIEDYCGNLQHDGGGTLLGGTVLNPGIALRDEEWFVPEDLDVDLDKLEQDIEALFDKHVTNPDLRAQCSVSYYEDEEDEDDED